MVYLNEGMEGGGTRFTDLDITVPAEDSAWPCCGTTSSADGSPNTGDHARRRTGDPRPQDHHHQVVPRHRRWARLLRMSAAPPGQSRYSDELTRLRWAMQAAPRRHVRIGGAAAQARLFGSRHPRGIRNRSGRAAIRWTAAPSHAAADPPPSAQPAQDRQTTRWICTRSTIS